MILNTRLLVANLLCIALAILGCEKTGSGSASGATEKQAAQSGAAIYVDQGKDWTDAERSIFYTQDQGAGIMPLTWMRALEYAGKPFLDDALERYGFLSNPLMTDNRDIPIGFAVGVQDNEQWIGMTCSACHTREIEVGGQAYRIDGGPAIIDAQEFLEDLDKAVAAVVENANDFERFAIAVLGGSPTDAAKWELRAKLEYWHSRNHLFTEGTLPESVDWGPGRMDAVTMIFNRIGGLSVGRPENNYIVKTNFEPGTAPARYPFLWNAWRQDCTQWAGTTKNGHPRIAQARNIGQVYGIFSTFHPRRSSNVIFSKHDFLSLNSTAFNGLVALDETASKIGRPIFPWAIDHTLVQTGKELFQDECAKCHGIREYPYKLYPEERERMIWETPVLPTGTDAAQSLILKGRTIDTSELSGAIIPDIVEPNFASLEARDYGVRVLQASALGTLVHCAVKTGVLKDVCRYVAVLGPSSAITPNPSAFADGFQALQGVFGTSTDSNLVCRSKDLAACANDACYEARVLEGVWAAAPYLHNGSVPTLWDLLQTADQRPKTFEVGPSYDPSKVGLAKDQSKFTGDEIETTGCEEIASGNSRCGHDFGTALDDEKKKALLEYLKTL